MPEGRVRQKFTELIKKLAEKYNGPLFPPHVTLNNYFIELPEKETIIKSKEFAKQISPFKIVLGRVGYTELRHMCLFIRVVNSKEIMNAYYVFGNTFGKVLKYTPHLSLFYGTLKNETKETILNNIGRLFSDTFEANSLFL